MLSFSGDGLWEESFDFSYSYCLTFDATCLYNLPCVVFYKKIFQGRMD